MSPERLAAADAQLLWLSAKVPNDQFLVYVFEGSPHIPVAVGQLRANAQRCGELRLTIRDDHVWRYPRWVPGEVGDDQIMVHAPVDDWRASLELLADLGQLDPTRMTWRAHVVPPNVVVVQIVHALADGTRSAALAGSLFGRCTAIPAVTPARGNLLWRAVIAARAHRQLLRDTAAGVVPQPIPPRPVLSINTRLGRRSVRRTLVVHRDRLHHPTVTVAALSAIAEALGGYLADRGEDVSLLGAEVPVAGPLATLARNNFGNVGVGLYPKSDRVRRLAEIKHDLGGQRRRAGHRAALASQAAFAAVPAALLRWGIGQFDPDARSDTVTGNTVVSSVDRGPADLSFGGHPVLLTAGYPALSPMMGLTHGVHGIGDTVAVSVHADPTVVDVDDYLDRLADALGRPPQR